MKESIMKEQYKPVNLQRYNKIHHMSNVQIKRPASIVPAPYSKDSFLSSYEKAFMINNLTARKETNPANMSVI